jgi:hypothetical protein
MELVHINPSFSFQIDANLHRSQMCIQKNDQGLAVVKTSDLSRTHLDRLVANGFISQVIKGWYFSTSPDIKPGSTSAWYSSFWYFSSVYLNQRFEFKSC